MIEAGPTPWDKEDRLVGNSSLPLTAEAMDAIGHLLDKVKTPISAVYRPAANEACVQTAHIIGKKFGIRARQPGPGRSWIGTLAGACAGGDSAAVSDGLSEMGGGAARGDAAGWRAAGSGDPKNRERGPANNLPKPRQVRCAGIASDGFADRRGIVAWPVFGGHCQALASSAGDGDH